MLVKFYDMGWVSYVEVSISLKLGWEKSLKNYFNLNHESSFMFLDLIVSSKNDSKQFESECESIQKHERKLLSL